MTMQKNWHIYLIRNKYNALYCGITTDVIRRFKQHEAGKGAKALKGKTPLHLVFSCLIGDHSQASKLEYHIKQLSKQAKERLIRDQPYDLVMYLNIQMRSKYEE